MFVIEDELHAEPQEGRFQTRQEAIAALQRLAAIPWDEEPNRAPCSNWRDCGRRYEVVEYDDTGPRWNEVSRRLELVVSAAGVQWASQDPGGGSPLSARPPCP